MKVMCIGQAAYDITIPMASFPEENKKIRFDERIECGGGSSSNCAYLLSKWKMNTYFAGAVGNDYYGDVIKKEFEDIGVNTKYLKIDKNSKTAASYIIANTSKGTRTIMANRPEELNIDDLDPQEEDFTHILVDGYDATFVKKMFQKNPQAIKIIDAGSLKEDTVELCHLVDYIVCSKDFAESYTDVKINPSDVTTLIKAYQKLKEDFKAQIVITLESYGSFTYFEDNYYLVPSIKVKAVDSTGAGDIYHGAFTYFLANGKPLLEIMKLANITGALSVSKIGGRFSIPLLDEVIKTNHDFES